MSKQFVSVVVGLVFASSAFGQVPGEVVSFYCSQQSSECVLLDPVPAGGFVVTDITSPGADFVWFYQDGELIWQELGSARAFQSGIPFPAGSTVTMTHGPIGTHANHVNVSGYIPCPAPCQSANLVPAVGSFGQAVMVLALVVAATLLLRRREDTKLG